jgi:hypothetical protein
LLTICVKAAVVVKVVAAPVETPLRKLSNEDTVALVVVYAKVTANHLSLASIELAPVL